MKYEYDEHKQLCFKCTLMAIKEENSYETKLCDKYFIIQQ